MEVVKAVVLALIRTYQVVVSPVLPPACRFHPTCSRYAYEAVAKHGAVLGVWLGARRLLRCHPFCPGGYDPVPEHPTFFRKASTSNAESTKASSGTLREPVN